MTNKAIALVLLVAAATSSYGQETQTKDSYLELLRSDLRMKKVEVLTRAMKLTDYQGKIFWPLYREFDLEMSALADDLVALIEDYGRHYATMTDEKAGELSERVLEREEKMLDLKREFVRRISKDISPRTGARFLQVQNMIQHTISLQVSSALPLIE